MKVVLAPLRDHMGILARCFKPHLEEEDTEIAQTIAVTEIAQTIAVVNILIPGALTVAPEDFGSTIDMVKEMYGTLEENPAVRGFGSFF